MRIMTVGRRRTTPGASPGTRRLLLSGGLVAGVMLALSVAGCGGGDDGDQIASANGGQATASATPEKAAAADRDSALEFAKCMRANGVPDFQDPADDSDGVQITLPDGADPKKVQEAMDKCKQYLPNGGEPTKADPQQLEQQRNFAKCMRANGVPQFPDPGADGGIKIEPGQGLDPQDPTFKEAERACAQYRSGASAGPTDLKTGSN